MRRYCFRLLIGLFAVRIFPPRTRAWLLNVVGVDVGRGVRVHHGLDVLGPQLVLGDGVFINSGVVLHNRAPIRLGAEVAIGPNVLITTTSHDLSDPRRRQGRTSGHPVVIHDGSWVGAGAVVLPAVTIAEGCVIAAGAVVTADTAPHGLYAGVPARRIKDLPVEGGTVLGAG